MMDLEELFAMDDLPKEDHLDLDIKARIKQRRRQLLVHSYLYYRLNTSLVTDYQYDDWAKELIQLQQDYPTESESAEYYEEFKDFQMGHSFALPLDEPWIHAKCLQLLEYRHK